MQINQSLNYNSLLKKVENLFNAAAPKIISIENSWDASKGTPVFTIEGQYTTRGWTEWTQGFQYGCALLQYEATQEQRFLKIGRKETVEKMPPHLTHIGVHDHGFNNISTYGNLWRMMNNGIIPENEWERNFYELALKVSGAIQGARWANSSDGLGYICSFNGPHSLFVDTIRSLRILGLSHRLGHVLMGEHDEAISLLKRLILHAKATARYNIYYGEGRDAFDVRGRTVHEAVFNRNDGNFRCPSTQQGYSPFSTWTRGLAWAITGFSEELEFLETLDENEFEALGGKQSVLNVFLKAATATADFYIEYTPTDGIPYWDTGAPGLTHMVDCLNQKSDPFNQHEPIDSSAAAIAAQGLIRLGRYLSQNNPDEGKKYLQAGLTTCDALFDEPYLSTSDQHQGLILHSVYHRPNGWDHVPQGQKVPCGESSMWGDYHAMELAIMLWREAKEMSSHYFFK